MEVEEAGAVATTTPSATNGQEPSNFTRFAVGPDSRVLRSFLIVYYADYGLCFKDLSIVSIVT